MNTITSKRWLIPDPLPSEVDEALVDYPPTIRQILYNRGCQTTEEAEAYLAGKVEEGDPFQLTDMEAAVERILRALDADESIAIYGDYDVDGVTATTLLVEVLREMGGQAEAYIPNRFDEGYGLNNEALDELKARGFGLVITVDCGIRSPREAEHAREIGLDIIITDHHHPHDEIPAATAVICQRKPGEAYPEVNLAGVGLAYKVAQGLLARRPLTDRSAADWLDLVALGTVADLVPLTGENRALVRGGLRLLRMGGRQGALSLALAAGLTVSKITASDIGFSLGPRLNAAGRLESALAAYDLLIARDVEVAGLLAQQLDDKNRKRQQMTVEMQTKAAELAAQEESDYLIFAVHPEFNSGVVGLAAARLVEQYYRPAVVGQIGEQFTRASCRSIPEFHITDALDECSDLMVRHGGHAMAAGFTISNENLPELQARLREIARRKLSEIELRPALRADVVIPLSELHPRLLSRLDQLQPTGLGNPDAVFVSRNVRVRYFKAVGEEGRHLRMVVTDGKIDFSAIAFRQGHWANQMPERVDLLYSFERHTYQGNEELQLNVRDIKPTEVTV
ncbi:MAG TPA: single-stranded-DNA-specific exonuclease RecJ [Anaerolineaceae bacterium]|nr:single-stranded-DNA-specific exonuclease RecJ [Anaerolineaceae bacterium]HNS37166.1 single-stranded-DNA-specific exonuclease RecJ [Anaerolineaceae bacterium]